MEGGDASINICIDSDSLMNILNQNINYQYSKQRKKSVKGENERIKTDTKGIINSCLMN